MRIKAKEIVRDTNWHKVFVFWPKRTEDGYHVFLGPAYRRWKVHMSSGKWVYRTELTE